MGNARAGSNPARCASFIREEQLTCMISVCTGTNPNQNSKVGRGKEHSRNLNCVSERNNSLFEQSDKFLLGWFTTRIVYIDEQSSIWSDDQMHVRSLNYGMDKNEWRRP